MSLKISRAEETRSTTPGSAVASIHRANEDEATHCGRANEDIKTTTCNPKIDYFHPK
jgi:hypothetical protein